VQSPILEVRSKTGDVLIKRDLYSFVQTVGAHPAFFTFLSWPWLAPFRVLLDGIEVEPPPEVKK